jgi:hypothetical protein
MGLMKKAVKYTSPVGFAAVKVAEHREAKAEESSEPKVGRKDRKAAERQAEWDAAGIVFQTKGVYEDKNMYILTLFSDRVEVEYQTLSLMKRGGLDTMPLENVTGVAIHAGVVFGKVTIQGMGQSMTAEKLPVDAVRKVKPLIEAQVAKVKGQAAAPVVAQPTESVSDKLLKLGQLRDAGILTPEEFEAKKTVLIEQL